jgi:hypothetical protein
VRLSHSYGQVIAQVVQDPDSGEGIGCVTISVKESASQTLQIVQDAGFETELNTLALSIARVIA